MDQQGGKMQIVKEISEQVVKSAVEKSLDEVFPQGTTFSSPEIEEAVLARELSQRRLQNATKGFDPGSSWKWGLGFVGFVGGFILMSKHLK